MRVALTILTLLSGTEVFAQQAPKPPQAPSLPEVRPGVLPSASWGLSYKEASEKAALEKKILCVWVAYKCPSTANQLPETIHCFVEEHERDRTQRVVVGIPNGRGWLTEAGTVLAADCCANEIHRVARGAAVSPNPTRFPPSLGWQPPPRGGFGMGSGGVWGNGRGACAT